MKIKIEEKNEIEKNKNIKMEKEIENLKAMLQKALKIHPKTLNKINKYF